LVRNVRERRAHSAAGRELRDEHHGLLDDRVDEQVSIHVALQP
jgi:hypothetical protein